MSEKILVVDDNQDIRDLVEQILIMRGFAVQQASSGGVALEQLQQESTDLVLLDVMMPGLSGYQVVEALRTHANPTLAKLPIVMMTAKSQMVDIERALTAGATDYLVKPFRPAALLEKVSDVLRNAKAKETR